MPLNRGARSAVPAGRKDSSDGVRPGEEALEALWLAQGGVDPETGGGWLTPRMQRAAETLRKAWGGDGGEGAEPGRGPRGP